MIPHLPLSILGAGGDPADPALPHRRELARLRRAAACARRRARARALRGVAVALLAALLPQGFGA